MWRATAACGSSATSRRYNPAFRAGARRATPNTKERGSPGTPDDSHAARGRHRAAAQRRAAARSRLRLLVELVAARRPALRADRPGTLAALPQPGPAPDQRRAAAVDAAAVRPRVRQALHRRDPGARRVPRARRAGSRSRAPSSTARSPTSRWSSGSTSRSASTRAASACSRATTARRRATSASRSSAWGCSTARATSGRRSTPTASSSTPTPTTTSRGCRAAGPGAGRRRAHGADRSPRARRAGRGLEGAGRAACRC